MTAFVYHEIACDYGHGDPDGPATGRECFNAFSDMGTATQVRATTKTLGWKTSAPGGRDYCPEHRKA